MPSWIYSHTSPPLFSAPATFFEVGDTGTAVCLFEACDSTFVLIFFWIFLFSQCRCREMKPHREASRAWRRSPREKSSAGVHKNLTGAGGPVMVVGSRASIPQLVEESIRNRPVAGSIPAAGSWSAAGSSRGFFVPTRLFPREGGLPLFEEGLHRLGVVLRARRQELVAHPHVRGELEGLAADLVHRPLDDADGGGPPGHAAR